MIFIFLPSASKIYLLFLHIFLSIDQIRCSTQECALKLSDGNPTAAQFRLWAFLSLSLYAAGASDSAHVRLLCMPQYTHEIPGRRWIHRGDPDEAGSMIKGSLVPVKVPRCSRWNAGIAFRAIVMSSWKENSSSLRGQFDWQNKRKPPPHPPPQKKNNGPVKNKTAVM